jgi:uncharacterized protein YbbK (DUF523 family)
VTRPARVLVSACLLGERVRWDGRDAKTSHPVLDRWLAEGRVVAFCPEVAGGLTVPRPAAELIGDRVKDRTGRDWTVAFERGAQQALEAAQTAGARIAVLKDGSPSCGSAFVYDGTFSGTRRAGQGRTAALLRSAGIDVFDETQIDAAAGRLAEIEGASGA